MPEVGPLCHAKKPKLGGNTLTKPGRSPSPLGKDEWGSVGNDGEEERQSSDGVTPDFPGVGCLGFNSHGKKPLEKLPENQLEISYTGKVQK